jgi:hypothetical protein
MWDLINQKFSNLTVIRLLPERRWHDRVWLCRCDCGNYRKVTTGALKAKHTTSCGCMHGGCKEGDAIRNRVYTEYKRQAIRRGLKFTLTLDQCLNLFKENCYYCGKPPSNILKHDGLKGKFVYNGIDRLDNNKGYKLENCVACCAVCNFAKRTMNLRDFKKWIRKVYKYLFQK